MDDVRSVQATATEGGTAETGSQEVRKETLKVEDFVKKVNLPLLKATLTEKELYDRCLAARAHAIAAVIVRPCDVDSALRILNMSSVRVASVAGYPWGSNATATKVYECRDLIRRGVREIYAFPNPGKMLSRQFQHQEIELIQMADDCLAAGVTLKIVIDQGLMNDEMKIILCRMAKRVNAHYVATTQPRDHEMLLKYCNNRASVEIGGLQTLDEACAAWNLGCKHATVTSVAALDAMVTELERYAKAT